MTEVDEARAALDAIAAAKRSMAEAVKVPFWRHALFGLLVALAMLAAALDGRPRLMPLLFFAALFLFLIQWDRRHMGMFVNGYRPGRTLPLTFGLMLSLVGLAFAALRLVDAGQPQLALLTVPAGFVIGLGASLWWERIFLAEMGAKR